ncbi:MAG: sulfatase-like hydrolase/transferase [Opitutales bacterium]
MDRPNLLLITADHWFGKLLSCAGHPVIHTPTLDSLAAGGVRYPNAYSECPVCMPARKTLLTGIAPETHGVINNGRNEKVDDELTLAKTLGNAGYQTVCVGKMHQSPQRWRVGFDEVFTDEEGRSNPDDYETYLADHGATGLHYAGGMSNNEYAWRPWHLEERLHVTNWATETMCRQIKRRDPMRPSFWYLSYTHPHPPLTPLQSYLDILRDVPIDDPVYADWCQRPELSEAEQRRVRDIRRAFYALCQHIDHQIRVVIGTLSGHGLLDNTMILFSSDHGDMLGDHGMWAKRRFFENAANVPMILSGPPKHPKTARPGTVDERPVGWTDIMPTLLDFAGVEKPSHCDGVSMVAETPREELFGIMGQDWRMLRRGPWKYVFEIQGGTHYLFNVEADRDDLHNLAHLPDHADLLADMQQRLIAHMPDWDREKYVRDGRLTGSSHRTPPEGSEFWPRTLSAQRGLQFP